MVEKNQVGIVDNVLAQTDERDQPANSARMLAGAQMHALSRLNHVVYSKSQQHIVELGIANLSRTNRSEHSPVEFTPDD